MDTRISQPALILALLALSLPQAQARGIKARGFDYVPGEIIVKFKEDSSALTRSQTLAAYGRHQAQAVNARGLMRVKLGPGEDMADAIAVHAGDPEIEYAQPNYIYRALNTPADAFYGQLWGLNNTGQTVAAGSYATNNPPGVTGMDIDAEAAWDLRTDCSSVTVAVVDTGINYNHDDLSTNMWNGSPSYPNHGYDFVANDNDPMDFNGHGTHVAGTIGAGGNNTKGTTGVCWNASLMAVRVLDAAGFGNTLSIAQGIDFAVANGAKVINMSLGGGSFDNVMNNALSNARANDVVVVVAAGNDDADNDATATYPCNYAHDNIVCVAALDQGFERASFSNYGAMSVDVGAPGTNTTSTWPLSSPSFPFFDFFNAGNGNWTFDPAPSAWEVTAQDYGNTVNVMSDPSGFNGMYGPNVDYTAYRSFNFTGVDVAILNYTADFSVRDVGDRFSIVYGPAGVPTTPIEAFENVWTDFFLIPLASEVPQACMGTTCSLGFNLTSDADTNVDWGVELESVSLETYTFDNFRYNTINGTSMATPHAAGIAALVWAYNPGFSYREVVNAVKFGGRDTASMQDITVSGKAANAFGSLIYINPPTGVSAVIQ